MIPIFEYMYPNAIAEFVFDQSSAHSAFAKDAVNVRPGRKQCLMHNTYIPMDNSSVVLHGRLQTMVFSKDLPCRHPDYKLYGQAKGMQHILEEHGLISVLQVVNGGKAVGEC